MAEPTMGNPEPLQCQRCQKWLRPGTEVWLELDWQTGLWYAAGEVSDEQSQGCFPFGAACARAALKNTKEKGDG